DYESVAGDVRDRLIPQSIRRMAGAAVFVGLVGAMALWSYRLGTRDATEVPIIRAMEGPARLQPEDPGGLQAAHQGLEVNAVLSGQPAPVPRERTPLEPAPPALAEEDGPLGELVVAAPASLPDAAEGEDLRMPEAEAQEVLAALEIGLAPDLGGAPAEADAPVEADLLPEGTTSAMRPLGRPSNLVRATAKAPAAAPKAQPKAATAVPAPGVAQAREVGSVSPGSRLVQLGAYDSEAITRQAWAQLVAKNGDLLGSKSLYVERTTSNARVFYRLRVAGFENTEQTRVMCEALRARSIDCIPVTLQ
ncbi:MAG: SPOR domain-containing protein, partial [Rhodobacteraceae bacterium]|nr:SPOR domain-containing protein [Paracoccaceae bacterium]